MRRFKGYSFTLPRTTQYKLHIEDTLFHNLVPDNDQETARESLSIFESDFFKLKNDLVKMDAPWKMFELKKQTTITITFPYKNQMYFSPKITSGLND